MHPTHTVPGGRSSLPIIGLCLLVICFRLGSSLAANHFYEVANQQIETMLIQQSLLQQIARLEQVEVGMIGTGTLPDVPLEPLLAGTSDSISALAAESPSDAGRVRSLFETFSADLRAEAGLIANGQVASATAFRESGALASGAALQDQLNGQLEASSTRKTAAMRDARIALIVPTAIGTVIVCVILIAFDRRRKRAYALLSGQERRFRSLIQQSTDIILVTDSRGQITYATPGAVHALGKSADELAGIASESFVLPPDQPVFRKLIRESLSMNGLPARAEARFVLRNGIPRSMDIAAVNLIDNDAAQGVVITAHDITERKMLLESLHYQAHHDNLTGLPNRLVLEDRLKTAIAEAQLNGSPVSVLFIDLDNFKHVNDRHGHATGDALLIAVASTLRSVLRMGDTIARIGGDEFVILLEDTEREYAVRVAKRISTALAALEVGDEIFAQGASIGIFLAHDGVASADLALQRADSAMYAVKATGKTGWYIYGDPDPARVMASVA